MKKNNIILMIMMTMFLFVGIVKAEEEQTTCTATDLNELRTMASNIKVTYITGEDYRDLGYTEPETGLSEMKYYYVDVKLFNLNSKLLVNLTTSGDNVVSTNHVVSYLDTDPEGVVTFRQNASDANVDYIFKVFPSSGNCIGETLRTIKLTVPKFNWYSELAVCNDIPDYYLCLRFTTYNVDGATFYDRVDEYKAKMLEQKESTVNGENNTLSETMNNISKYKYVIVGIIVAVGVIATVLIVRRKKSVL